MQQVTRINAARFKGIPAEKAARFKKKKKRWVQRAAR